MSTLRGAAVFAIFLGLSASSAHAQTQVRVNCESHDFNPEVCTLGDPIQSVTLIRQISDASCNGNFAFGGDVLVTQNGCRADFAAVISTSRAIHEIACHSNNRRRTVCVIPEGAVHALWASNKVSSAPCRTGLDFALIGPNILEVRNGCRATFQYTTE